MINGCLTKPDLKSSEDGLNQKGIMTNMKIYVRVLVDGELILEEIEASPVQGFENCAISHQKNRWIVHDIPIGLLIVSGQTRKDCIEHLISKRIQLENARRSELYQKRIKEFEEMKRI